MNDEEDPGPRLCDVLTIELGATLVDRKGVTHVFTGWARPNTRQNVNAVFTPVASAYHTPIASTFVFLHAALRKFPGLHKYLTPSAVQSIAKDDHDL